jgi:hypothetical protein
LPLESAPDVYVVEPQYNGETGNVWKDTALIRLIFDARSVTGEIWVEIEGGHGGQRAWRVCRQ